jgi:succinylglutamate desuccinylase
MHTSAAPLAEGTSHVIGRYTGDSAGPTILVAGGIHGNEPSGVRALERVLSWLEGSAPAFRGTIIGLAGNLAALERSERFLEEDLNRIWLPDRIAALRRGETAPSPDARQQAELLTVIDRIFAEAPGPVVFLDLHTSSARGEPFVCIGDTLRNRALALQFPVPVILGLEEQIDGALLEYVNTLGHVTIGVEAGQHDHPESIDRHEAFVTLALIAAGCIEEKDVPQAAPMRALLSEAVGKLPPVLEVRYRHAITPADDFEMRAGFANFQPISKDDLMASDAAGEVRAIEGGRVLLPLYQGLGNDGFFIVRRISPRWLRLSAWLRRVRADRLATLLPGVAVDSDHTDTLRVDTHVARWFTVELFHLLGFRKRRSAGESLRFSRRPENF